MSDGKWKRGQSGNPRGRPKKGRALAELLVKHGSKRILYGGRLVSNRELFAENVWRALATGRLKFDVSEDEVRFEDLTASEWVSLARFVMTHIDGGAPRVEVEQEQAANGTRITMVEVVKTH